MPMPRHAPSFLLRCCLGLAMLLPGAAPAAPTDEVQALVNRGQFKEAYERGRRYPDLLGEPGFDYWFGLAAIDAGHPGEGTLALERYIVLYPNDRTARLELARGYFLMRDDERAKAEFDDILATNPPPKVRDNVRGYLDAIRVREARYRKTFSFFAEFGTGYDSNVNGGVASDTVRLTIGPVNIGSTGQKTDNGFLFAAAGGQLNIPLVPGWKAFVAMAADTRNHFTADTYDLRSMTVAGGAEHTREKDLLRVSAAYGNLWFDNARFRNLSSLTAEWYRRSTPGTTWNLYGQWAQLGYTGDNQPRDSDLFVVGAGLRRSLGGPQDWTLTVSANAGQEQNRKNRDDFTRILAGGRLGLSFSPREGRTLSLAASIQGSDYAEPHVFLADRRRDWFYALEAGSEHALDRAWTLRFDIAMTRNRSNIDLYDFNRNVAAVKLRYDLR